MWQVPLFSLLVLPTSYFEEDVFVSHSFIVRMDMESLYRGEAPSALDFSPRGFTFISLIFVDTT